MIVKQHTAHRSTLEEKTSEFQEQLQKWQMEISTCDQKLVKLEAFKAEIEKKIAA